VLVAQELLTGQGVRSACSSPRLAPSCHHVVVLIVLTLHHDRNQLPSTGVAELAPFEFTVGEGPQQGGTVAIHLVDDGDQIGHSIPWFCNQDGRSSMGQAGNLPS